jgi:hypothetical protein
MKLDPSGAVLIGGEQRTELWAPMAHRRGVLRPLLPKYFKRPMGSYEECVETLRLRCKIDPDFARHWASWWLTGYRVDGQFDPGMPL